MILRATCWLERAGRRRRRRACGLGGLPTCRPSGAGRIRRDPTARRFNAWRREIGRIRKAARIQLRPDIGVRREGFATFDGVSPRAGHQTGRACSRRPRLRRGGRRLGLLLMEPNAARGRQTRRRIGQPARLAQRLVAAGRTDWRSCGGHRARRGGACRIGRGDRRFLGFGIGIARLIGIGRRGDRGLCSLWIFRV
jgi:hypothetical protein